MAPAAYLLETWRDNPALIAAASRANLLAVLASKHSPADNSTDSDATLRTDALLLVADSYHVHAKRAH